MSVNVPEPSQQVKPSIYNDPDLVLDPVYHSRRPAPEGFPLTSSNCQRRESLRRCHFSPLPCFVASCSFPALWQTAESQIGQSQHMAGLGVGRSPSVGVMDTSFPTTEAQAIFPKTNRSAVFCGLALNLHTK
jgi:hypothetical protein